MPTPVFLKASFYPQSFYHIVCKSIDGLLLFQDELDYKVFQNRLKKFTGDFIDVWSFCLLHNHTHYIVKVKAIESIRAFINKLAPSNVTSAMKSFNNSLDDVYLFDRMIERQVNSFLVSFANYLNYKYRRKGGIFQKPFKRIEIVEESHLQQAIIYTNANAQKHQLVSDYKNYPFSSYNHIIHHDSYFLDTESVIDFFGGLDKFVLLHKSQVAYFYQKNWPSSKLE